MMTLLKIIFCAGGVCLAALAAMLCGCLICAGILLKKYPPIRLYEKRREQEDYAREGEIAPIVLHYAVKLEDQNFYIHPGYDLKAIKTAIRINLRTRSLRYGASTISQQLVKNLYFGFSKNPLRKITEIFMVTKLEKQLSKQQILEFYLNLVDFGCGNWGIVRAAEFYFGKSPADLTENQALVLLSMLPAPDSCNVLVHPRRFIRLRDQGLKTLVKLKVLEPEQAEEVKRRHPQEMIDEELVSAENISVQPRLNMENALAKSLKKALG